MKASLRTKLEQLIDRYDELGHLLSDSDTIADQKLFRTYSMEYAEIEPVVLCYQKLQTANDDLEEAVASAIRLVERARGARASA